MSIINYLSSQIGDRSEESNRQVAEQCLTDPRFLLDIVHGLQCQDHKMVGDCAEVLTMVSEKSPELVAPYIHNLFSALSHKKPRARWEAVHAISNITHLVPKVISENLNVIKNILENDSSIIARDYAVKTVSNYAQTSVDSARNAYPVLAAACSIFDGRHAHFAFPGLEFIAEFCPEKREDVVECVKRLLCHKKAVISKRAKKLLALVENL